MAPLTKRQKKALTVAPPAPVIDPADRISKLPEEIQVQILSFLPAQEAVRTCVLAQTWRHVWKFARRLLITGKSVEEASEFVDRLLRVRRDGLELASLDTSEIRFDTSEEVDDDEACLNWDDTSRLNRWIRHVLECQIQRLRVDISTRGNLDAYLQIMSTMSPLVSQHLTRLELTGVWFTPRCINLDGCPALEHLEINECCLCGVMKMTSRSLKHLVITSCDSNLDRCRIQISVPRQVSLWLENMDIRTPVLARLPELVGAKVHIGSYLDYCNCEDHMDCYHVMRTGDTSDIDFDIDDEEGSGDYAGQNIKKCVVLEGLAQAKDLVLIADHSTYIFRRDLRWCPTFSKLKTLVLIGVYRRGPADCSACMLEHVPVLEKLKLILDKVPRARGEYKVEMKGFPDAKVKSTKISQYLQIVEINCEDVNERFLCILNFLGTLNIWFQFRATEGSK